MVLWKHDGEDISAWFIGNIMRAMISGTYANTLLRLTNKNKYLKI